MNEAALKIILVEESPSTGPAAQSAATGALPAAAMPPSAAQPPPVGPATAAPTAPGAAVPELPAVPATPRAGGRPADEPPAERRDAVREAAGTFAEHLANAAGLAPLVQSMRGAMQLVNDGLRVARAMQSGAPSATQPSEPPPLPPAVSRPADQTPTSAPSPQPPKPEPVTAAAGQPPEIQPPTSIQQAASSAAAADIKTPAMPVAEPAPPPVVTSSPFVPPPLPTAAKASAVASSTAAPAASSAASSMASVAAAAGPVAIALGAVAAAAVVTVGAIKAFGSMIRHQAELLEGYSPQISAARAQSELREMQAMFARADRIGPQVARWEQVRGDVSAKMSDILTELLKVVLDVVDRWEPQINAGVTLLGAGPELIRILADFYATWFDVWTGNFSAVPADLKAMYESSKELLKESRKFFDEQRDKEDPLHDPYLDQFFQILPQRVEQQRRSPPTPVQRPRRDDRTWGLPDALGATLGAGGP